VEFEWGAVEFEWGASKWRKKGCEGWWRYYGYEIF